MKKSIIILSLFLGLSSVFSQSDYFDQFNQFGIEPGVGLSKVQDYTSVTFGNFNLGLRYSFLPSLAIRTNLNYNLNDIEEFSSASFMAVVNFRALLPRDQANLMKNWTILGSIGGNYSHYNGNITTAKILNRKSNFHLRARFDLLYKISNNISLMASLVDTFGVNEDRFNGLPGTNTTSIFDFNLGVVIGIGNKEKVHADWFVPKEKETDKSNQNDTLFQMLVDLNHKVDSLENNFSDLSNAIEVIKKDTKGLYIDPITFDHDSDKVKKIFNQRIKGIATYLHMHPNTLLSVNAYASLPGTDSYNLDISSRRAQQVKSKLIDAGAPGDRINIHHHGELYSRDGKESEPYDRVVSFQFINN